MSKKDLSKQKIELINLKKIVDINHSFKDDFTKQNQHCIEVYLDNDQILYLAAYDNDQIKQWHQYLKKSLVFYDWFDNLKTFVEKDQDKLTEQASFKLREYIEFVEQFSQIEIVEIPFVDKEVAIKNSKKNAILKQQQKIFQYKAKTRSKSLQKSSSTEELKEESKLENQSSSEVDSEEFKTPTNMSMEKDSVEFEVQGGSPHESPSNGKAQKKKLPLLLDGKTVGFKDFEILELIGEGSFG